MQAYYGQVHDLFAAEPRQQLAVQGGVQGVPVLSHGPQLDGQGGVDYTGIRTTTARESAHNRAREAQEFELDMSTKHILIGCTGSVATIKLLELIQETKKRIEDCEIRVVVTEKSVHFLDLAAIREEVTVYVDADEWSAWKGRGDPVLHIDLVKWADVFLIAPLDANSMGKIASGICDNLLLCIVRAWDVEKPLLFAPAMNTKMWTHPVTAEQVAKLCSWGYKQIPPIEKKLMCGDVGTGAMAEVATVVEWIRGVFMKK